MTSFEQRSTKGGFVMWSKQWVMLGAMTGFFGVAFGAFGAHFLKDVLDEKGLSLYQTGVHYQMLHALALIGLGIWSFQQPINSESIFLNTQLVGWAFTLGILLFSGSLYGLALTRLPLFGPLTPLGGLSFLMGWITFAFLAWKA